MMSFWESLRGGCSISPCRASIGRRRPTPADRSGNRLRGCSCRWLLHRVVCHAAASRPPPSRIIHSSSSTPVATCRASVAVRYEVSASRRSASVRSQCGESSAEGPVRRSSATSSLGRDAPRIDEIDQRAAPEGAKPRAQAELRDLRQQARRFPEQRTQPGRRIGERMRQDPRLREVVPGAHAVAARAELRAEQDAQVRDRVRVAGKEAEHRLLVAGDDVVQPRYRAVACVDEGEDIGHDLAAPGRPDRAHPGGAWPSRRSSSPAISSAHPSSPATSWPAS